MTEPSGHIFLSHGSENRDDANGLTRYLEERGLRIWIAPRDVRPGVDYSEALQQAIEGCAAFVVLVTDKANRSPYVRVETEMAFSLHKPIFPIRTSEVKPGPGLALFLKIRHWTDAFGPQRDESLERLARELRSIAGLPDAAPIGEPAGIRQAEQPFAPPPQPAEPAAPPAPPHWAAPPHGAPPSSAPGPARPSGGFPPMAIAGIGIFLLVLVALFFLLRTADPSGPVPQPGGQGQQGGQGEPSDPNQPGQPGEEGNIYFTPPNQPDEQQLQQPAEQQEPPTEGFYDPPQ